MARKKIKSATDQRKFTLIYNDFIESNLLNYYEKMIFIVLKKYADNNTMKAFPSLNKLHKVTGISLSQVKRSINHMKELGVINVEHRNNEIKGHQSNIYTLYDYAEIWSVDTDSVVVTEKEEKKTIVLEVHVADFDMGKVIGKQGRIAKAIRSVVKAAAAKEDKKVIVDIMD